MPYIKKGLRPIFDSAVILAQKGRIVEASEQILLGMKDMEPEVMDGCLNYAFTQMLRKVEDLVTVKIIMVLVINTLFWSQPKYIRFERVEGLLGRMIKEYRRRGWKRQKKVIQSIGSIMGMNDHKTNDYEDKCIERNGDI